MCLSNNCYIICSMFLILGVMHINRSAVCLCTVESDVFSDGQTQRGMDRYLDSLFDPVLSDSSVVSTDAQSTRNYTSTLTILLWKYMS